MRFDPALAIVYATITLPYVFAIALGVLVPMLGVLCYSSFGPGVAIVAGMFAIEAIYMFVGAISIGISIFYTDFALVFVCAIGLLRLLFERNRPSLQRGWLLFCVVAAASLLTGLVTYGSTAGVQARPYFYLVAAAIYGASFSIDEKRLRVVFNALAAIVVLLLCIVTYRWIVYYTPIPSLLPVEGNYNNDGPVRVIRSYEALVLAQMLVLSLFFVRGSAGLMWLRAVSPMVFAVVLVLQHRSVWASAIAGICASLAVIRLQRAKAGGQVALLIAMATVTAIPMVTSERLSSVSEQIASGADAALADRGSAGERLSSWKEIVNNWAAAGPRSILIGQSFGTDPSRFVRDDQGHFRKLVYTAHNMYVQTLFNTGLLGLGAFLMAAAYIVRGLFRLCASRQAPVEAQALLVLVLMQLVYYVPYGTDYLQSLIFGVALSYVGSCQRRSEKRPEQEPGASVDERKAHGRRWSWA